MKSIISLVVILPVCLLVCSEAHRAGIVKRKAEDGKYYVLGNRKGCVSLNESHATCPVSWTLSPYFAKHYMTNSKAIEASLSIFGLLGLSKECKGDLKATLCSQGTPKCFEDGRADYGEAKTTCEKIYGSCPKQIADQYKKKKFCESIMTGMQPLSKCVDVTDKISGVCPQPKHKMPTYVLKSYREQSENLKDTIAGMEKESKLFSAECVKKYREMACNPVYCSKDEEKFISEYDQEDCEKVIKLCFDKALGSIPADQAVLVGKMKDTLKTNCQSYPKGSSAQLIAAPPTSKPVNGIPSIKFAKSLCFFASAFFVKVAFFNTM